MGTLTVFLALLVGCLYVQLVDEEVVETRHVLHPLGEAVDPLQRILTHLRLSHHHSVSPVVFICIWNYRTHTFMTLRIADIFQRNVYDL